MKREGRQHGMVRTYRILPSPWNPKPEPRFVQQFDSPPTAGLFTKVSMKPTNHSKFTGRCGRPRCPGCHMHPACKAKDKTKGTHKFIRSSDMATNYRLVTWRVVDGRPGLKLSGFSASRILDHLADHDYDDYYEGNDDHDYDHDHDHDYDDDQRGLGNDGFEVSSPSLEETENYEAEYTDETIADHSKDDDDDDEKIEGVYVDVVDDDDDLKFVLNQDLDLDLEEEGWCLVGEI
ncbi:hypothetical protein PTKIN_Ptkin07bG0019100 [Pterospermum kingtungense]